MFLLKVARGHPGPYTPGQVLVIGLVYGVVNLVTFGRLPKVREIVRKSEEMLNFLS